MQYRCCEVLGGVPSIFSNYGAFFRASVYHTEDRASLLYLLSTGMLFVVVVVVVVVVVGVLSLTPGWLHGPVPKTNTYSKKRRVVETA